MKEYKNLTCISARTSVQLSNTHNIAAFIMNEGLHGDVVIKTEDGNTLLNTFGVFIDRIADDEYRGELLKELIPMQTGSVPVYYINENTEARYMSSYERAARRADYYRELYPEGTRLELISMDDPAPVESGMRGSVDYVDDACQIHMKWDNGRTLAVIPHVDNFRKLTQAEIDEENDAICVEETVEDNINDDQGEGFDQSM